MGDVDYWDNEAARFDEEPDHSLTDPTVRAAWAALLLPLMPTAPARIVDLGCGTGSVSLLLAEAGHHVSGLDFSPAMIDKAREKSAAAGVTVDFRLGDAAAPPWPSSSFDVAFCRHVLWAMEDPDEALRRWLALLVPDGVLVLVEGRWWTGGGMSAAEVSRLVVRQREEAEVVMLNSATFWGSPVQDERFAIVSRR